MKIIAAFCNKQGIGIHNNIPWKLNSDLKRFRSLTIGNGNNAVIMGSKTWKDPLMPWPLPDRKNVLATSRESELPGADLYISGDLCTEIKKLSQKERVWIIGGINILEQTIEIVEEFYLSRIKGKHSCDGFLPLNKIKNLFEKTWTEKHETVEFQVWKKRNKV